MVRKISRVKWQPTPIIGKFHEEEHSGHIVHEVARYSATTEDAYMSTRAEGKGEPLARKHCLESYATLHFSSDQ